MKKYILLIVIIASMQSFTSFAQTQVYDLFGANLINPTGCGSIKYKSPGNGDWGFSWTSNGTSSPTSITVELNYAVNCAGVPNNGTVRLNGVNQGSQPTPGPYYCSCGPPGSAPTTWTLNPADYNVVGLNTVLLKAISSAEGINVISAYANAYARVTINYGPAVATPEIDIEGFATSILNGDSTPITGDGTEYGSVFELATLDHTFAIQNEAVNDLTLTATPNVTISGSSAFSIQAQPSSGTIVSGASVPFVVRFAPTCTTLGVQTAVVTVESDDPDESVYTFTVQGTGYSALPNAVTQNITVELDATGNATIVAADVNNGSTYSCGTGDISIDRTTFSCADIGSVTAAQSIAFTYVGDVAQNTHSHGAGYNPNTNEFWYPEWAGSTIYTYDTSHNVTGSFTAPVNPIMQLWMDKSSSDYYTANWDYYTINRIDGNTVVWSYDLGTTASSVTTDDLYVFAMNDYTNTIVVLDKTTGSFVKNIPLPGYISTYGGLVYANDIIYISGYDYSGFSTVPNTWNAIHSFDANTGNYISSVATAEPCYNTAFDGETIWVSPNSGTIYGYKVSEGNTYENGGAGNRVVLTVTDAVGNTAKATARVTVKDIIAPVITSNGDKNVSTDLDVCGATVVVSASATDNCTVGTPTGVRSDGELLSDLYPTGTTTISWNVIDTNGNAAVEVIQTIVVTDNQLPVITSNGDINVTTDLNVCGATVVVSASATDNCTVGTPIGVRSDGGSLTDLYVTGTTTITWDVKDVNGNDAVAVIQTITVLDTQNPTITTLSAISVNADAGVCTYASAQLTAPTATDNCNVVSVEVSPVSLVSGANTVTWTVTDSSGLTATSTQTVTVVDAENPTITALSAISVNADAGVCTYASAQLTTPTAADNCSVVSVVASPVSLVSGANTVIWTVTDGAGLTATSTQTVTVVDTENPTIATLSAMNVNTDSGICTYASVQLTAPTTADNCSVVSVVASPASLVSGANTVTWTVTDGSGLTATSTQTVTVVDNEAPVVLTKNSTVQLDASGNASIVIADINNGSTDNCGIATVALDKTTFTCANVGANTVILKVTDNNGNVASQTAIVTVEDKISPVVFTKNITVQLDASSNVTIAAADVNNGSTDNCGIRLLELDRATFSCANIGDNTVTLRVTDNSGNVSYGTATVTVVNSQPNLIRKHFDNVLFFDNSSNIFKAFSWYKNGLLVPSQTAQYFKDNGVLNGTYYAIATKVDGTVVTTCPLTFSPSVEVEYLKIAPNPVRSNSSYQIFTNVDSAKLQNARITVFNILGTLIMDSVIDKNEVEMVAPSVEGIYIVKMTLTSGKYFTKNLLVRN